MTVIDQNVQNGTPSTVDGLATSTTSDNSIHPDMEIHIGVYFFLFMKVHNNNTHMKP